jgi:hypothetical protein
MQHTIFSDSLRRTGTPDYNWQKVVYSFIDFTDSFSATSFLICQKLFNWPKAFENTAISPGG